MCEFYGTIPDRFSAAFIYTYAEEASREEGWFVPRLSTSWYMAISLASLVIEEIVYPFSAVIELFVELTTDLADSSFFAAIIDKVVTFTSALWSTIFLTVAVVLSLLSPSCAVSLVQVETTPDEEIEIIRHSPDSTQDINRQTIADLRAQVAEFQQKEADLAQRYQLAKDRLKKALEARQKKIEKEESPVVKRGNIKFLGLVKDVVKLFEEYPKRVTACLNKELVFGKVDKMYPNASNANIFKLRVYSLFKNEFQKGEATDLAMLAINNFDKFKKIVPDELKENDMQLRNEWIDLVKSIMEDFNNRYDQLQSEIAVDVSVILGGKSQERPKNTLFQGVDLKNIELRNLERCLTPKDRREEATGNLIDIVKFTLTKRRDYVKFSSSSDEDIDTNWDEDDEDFLHE